MRLFIPRNVVLWPLTWSFPISISALFHARKGCKIPTNLSRNKRHVPSSFIHYVVQVPGVQTRIKTSPAPVFHKSPRNPSDEIKLLLFRSLKSPTGRQKSVDAPVQTAVILSSNIKLPPALPAARQNKKPLPSPDIKHKLCSAVLIFFCFSFSTTGHVLFP